MDRNQRAFLHSTQFDDIWEKLGLKDEDLRSMQNFIITKPNVGQLFRNTGGFRTMRMGSEKEGKKGGYRVIYMDLSAYSFVYLLMLYPKSEKTTLTDAEKKVLRVISKTTIDAFRKREVQW